MARRSTGDCAVRSLISRGETERGRWGDGKDWSREKYSRKLGLRKKKFRKRFSIRGGDYESKLVYISF